MHGLLGKLVYFDTNLFIYAVESGNHLQDLFAIVTRLFEFAMNRQISALTSELTLAEVLVGAYKASPSLVDLYENLLVDRPGLSVYPVDRKVLRHAAQLRSQEKISLADAIHLSTALYHRADIFITHDKRIYTPASLTKLTLEDLLDRD